MGRTSKRRKGKRGPKASAATAAQPPVVAAAQPEVPEAPRALNEALPPLWRRAPLSFGLAAALLSLQFWLPLSYYLSDYPWDERFSWRMFSTVRSLSCQVQAWEGVEGAGRAQACPNGSGRCAPLRLTAELHMVWVNLLKRGRREVLRRFVEERCSKPEARLYVSLSCPHPEAPHPLLTIQSPLDELCAHPEALLSAPIAELLAREEGR